MKDKKHLFLKLLCFTFMLGSTAAGAAACKDKPTEPSIPEGYDKTFSDVGAYYADEGETRNTIDLTDSAFTLKLGSQTISGTYLFNGTTLRLVTTDGTIIEAQFVGDTLTLTYNSRQYTFLRNVEYTVTFEMNGGSAMQAQKVLNGKKLEKPADPVKVEEGKEFAFIGWYTDATYKEEFSFDAAVRRNVTVYARFVELLSDGEYSVTFNGYADLNTETTGGKLFLDTNANKDKYQLVAKDGAKFLGWWYSSYNDGAKLTAKYEGEEIHENIVLYPIWEEANKPAVSVTDKKIAVTGKATAITVYKVTDGARVKVQDVSPEAPDFAFADKDTGDYVVVVKNGDNITEAYYANKTLARVCQFEIEEPSVFKFRGVEGAERYLLKIECGTENHSHETIDLGTNTYYNFADCDMKEGGITFRVTAVAKAGYGNSVSGVFKTERELAAVTNLAADNVNEKLTWTNVQYADYYLISVNDGEAFRWDGTTFDLKGYKKGEYRFSLIAVGKGWNNSAAVTTTWTKGSIAAPAKPVIEDGYTVKWNAVAGATGYKLKIDDKTIDVTGTQYTLTAADYEAGKATYEISVCAVDASGESLYSDTLTVKGEMDNILDYDSGLLTWNPVLGVEKYEVQLNDGEATLTNTASANITFTQKGENKLKVRVYGATGEDATWLELSVTTYAVGYNVGASEKMIENKYIAEGDIIALPETDFNGYVFSGWYTEANGGGKKVAAAYGVSPRLNYAGDLTLYAKWESRNYKVSLDAGSYSDTDLSAGGTVAYKQAFTLPVPESNDGNRAFAGWYYGSVQVTDQNGDSLRNWPYLISGNTVPMLKARWEYILEFEKIEGVDGYAVKRATDGAQYLTELKIPATYKGKKVLRIAAEAFGDSCSKITKISLPNTLTEIELTAFGECDDLQSVEIYNVDGVSDPAFYSSNGAIIKNDAVTGKTLYFVPAAHKGDDGVFTVADGVQTITSEVFKNIEDIEKIRVAASVTTVQASAFANSRYVKEIEFLEAENGADEKSLFIDEKAFESCSKLTKITLPARVKELKLFDDEETKVGTANSWRYYASVFNSCNALEEIEVTGKAASDMAQVYTSKDGMLLSADGRTLLYYPAAKKNADGETETTLVLPDTVTKIGRLVFYKNTKLKTFAVPQRVVSIGASAFEECTSLDNLTFEGEEDNENLNIEERAFYGCKALTQLTLSENVRYIGKFAFGGTSTLMKLTTLTVNSNGNVKFENGAFAQIERDSATGAILGPSATTITTLNIGAGLTNVDISAVFDGSSAKLQTINVDENNTYYYQGEDDVIYDKNLDAAGKNIPTKILYFPVNKDGEYVIPNTVNKIGSNTFISRKKLQKIVIGNNVTSIGDYAFRGCTGLTDIVWGGAAVGEMTNPLTIGRYAFQDCKFDSFELPYRTQYLGDGAFYGCEFETFTFEYGVWNLEIGAQAFKGCEYLKEIEIPEGVVALGDGAFMACTSLERVKFPASLERIGSWIKTGGEDGENATYTFDSMNLFKFSSAINDRLYISGECKSLVSVEVAEGNKRYASRDGLLYGKYIAAEDTTDSETKPNDGDLTILYFCPMAKEGKVTLPITLREIYKEAFACNTGVTAIDFEEGEGSGAFSIGSNALYNAKLLTSFTLPSGMEKIEAGLFRGCAGLTQITIPNTVNTIAAGAFEGCTGLTTLTFEAGNDENALTIEDGKTTGTSSGSSSTTTYIGAFGYYSSTSGSGSSTTNYSCNSLVSVTLPKRLTYLGAYAFAYCSGLKTVDFGADSNLSVIGDGAFYGSALEKVEIGATVTADETTGVTTIALPSRLTEIRAQAFDGVKFPEKTEIVIPATVTAFGYDSMTTGPYISATSYKGRVFNKTNVKAVTFENNSQLEKVSASAFIGMTQLESVDFGDNSALEETEWASFQSCSALKNVDFGENSKLKKLGTCTFNDCTALETITLPASLESLEGNLRYGVFNGCTKLKSVIFDTYKETDAETGAVEGKCSLRYIHSWTFENTGLTSFAFPSTIEVLDVGTIGKEIFKGCTALKEVTLSDTVADLTGIFDLCGSIEKLNLPTDKDGNATGYFTAEGPVVYNKTGTEIVHLIGELPEEYTLKNTVTKLGASIFAGQAKLKKVTIPASVMEIGEKAFFDCINLEEVNFETNGALSTIGAAAFRNCVSLKSIRIPNGVTKLNAYTFYNCKSLTKVQLPEGLTHIGYYFYDYYNVEKTDNSGGFVFAHCEKLAEINIPESTQWIQNYSFLNCKSLTEIALNAGDKKIGEGAFANCTALRKVMLGANVKTLSSKLFINCTSLESVVSYGDEEGETPVVDLSQITGYGYLSTSSSGTQFTLGASTFANCTAIKEAVLSSNTDFNVMGDNLFDGCTNLAYVNKVKTGGTDEAPEYTSYLPNQLAYIGKYAFRNTALTRVRMPDALKSLAGLGSSIVKDSDYTGSAAKLWKDAYEYQCGPTKDSGAFDGCTQLTYLDLNKVIRIGSLAFRNCPLTDVAGTEDADGNITGALDLSNVQVFGKGAFAGTGLKAVDLTAVWVKTGTSNTTEAKPPMGFGDGSFNSTTFATSADSEGVFENCKQLKKVTFSNKTGQDTLGTTSTTVKVELGKLMFKNCVSLEKVELAQSTVTLADQAFYGCSNLNEIAIPGKLTNFGSYTFAHCTSLESIDLSKSTATSIGGGLFDGCTKLADVKLNGAIITSIGNYAFRDCSSLVSEVPEGTAADKKISAFSLKGFVKLKNIYTSAFEGCSSLETVELPTLTAQPTTSNGKMSIAASAFRDCSALKTVTLSKNVNTISENAFMGCTNLEEITVASDSTFFESKNQMLYTKGKEEIVFVPAGYAPEDGVFKLAEGATLKVGALTGCKNVKKVILPESMTSIPSKLFQGATYLEEVVISSTTTIINDYAFDGSGIKKISYTVPVTPEPGTGEGTETGEGGEAGTGTEGSGASVQAAANESETETEALLESVFPETLTSIGQYAFMNTKLEKVILPATLKNPAGSSSSTYTVKDGAFSYSTLKSVVIEGAETSFGKNSTGDKGVFANCTHLTSIEFKAETGYFGQNLFYGCTALTSVVLPAKATELGAGMFAGCTNLTSVTIPESLTVLPNRFYSGTSITQVVLPEGLETIEYEAFAYCKNLTSVTFPSTLKTINDRVFKECEKLTSVTLPEGLTELGGFSDCPNLQSINIPSTVTTIRSGAFDNTTSLRSVVIPAAVQEMRGCAFDGWTAEQTIYIEKSLSEVYNIWKTDTESGFAWLIDVSGSSENQVMKQSFAKIVWNYKAASGNTETAGN